MDPAQVVDLTARTLEILGSGCEVLVMEAERSSIDLDLAWGTGQPTVQPITATEAGAVAGPQPLAEDGESWKAIVEAASRASVDVIVLSQDRTGRLRRLLTGSAVNDVVAHAPLPVLVLPALGAPS
ncbi:universal stress protein [Desertimonas flava]|uniref:universal stress protein n=1 Tax=Desertimonas flava TaxID=2064846 RepID=UPI0013C48B49|nr:universal stress protein [Desertimonas flava]